MQRNKLKITIQEIAIASIALALLVIMKYITLFVIPRINGYPALELYYILSFLIVLIFPWKSSLFAVLLAPIIWFFLGLIETGLLSFLIEYFFPMFLPLFLIFHSQRASFLNLFLITFYIFICGWIKLLFSTISGHFIFHLPWIASLNFNFAILALTIFINPIICLMLIPRIWKLRSDLSILPGFFKTQNQAICIIQKFTNVSFWKISSVKKIHSGYTNHSYKIFIKSLNQIYHVRIPKNKIVDWKNEKIIYEKLFDSKNWKLNIFTGVLIKKWQKGTNPKHFSLIEKNNLINAIKNLHKINGDNVKKINFKIYNQFLIKINSDYASKYLKLIQKYKNDKFVLSHTDIHKKNILIYKNKLSLIDFEWTCMAPEYLDYAVLKINEKIVNPNLNPKKLNDYVFIFLIFSLLWTYSMIQKNIQKNKMKKLQKETEKKLKFYF